jgi:hypothetical protein
VAGFQFYLQLGKQKYGGKGTTVMLFFGKIFPGEKEV